MKGNYPNIVVNVIEWCWFFFFFFFLWFPKPVKVEPDHCSVSGGRLGRCLRQEGACAMNFTIPHRQHSALGAPKLDSLCGTKLGGVLRELPVPPSCHRAFSSALALGVTQYHSSFPPTCPKALSISWSSYVLSPSPCLWTQRYRCGFNFWTRGRGSAGPQTVSLLLGSL